MRKYHNINWYNFCSDDIIVVGISSRESVISKNDIIVMSSCESDMSDYIIVVQKVLHKTDVMILFEHLICMYII